MVCVFHNFLYHFLWLNHIYCNLILYCHKLTKKFYGHSYLFFLELYKKAIKTFFVRKDCRLNKVVFSNYTEISALGQVLVILYKLKVKSTSCCSYNLPIFG